MERNIRKPETTQERILSEWNDFAPLLNGFSPEQVLYIMRAFDHSYLAHSGQVRKKGEPFFAHPKGVAVILLEAGVRDHIAICAALLHDVVEDTKYFADMVKNRFPSVSPYKAIRELFPEEENRELPLTIAELTKYNTEEISKEKAKKIYLHVFPYISLRAQEVKMADIIHNLPTFDVHEKKKQRKKLREISKHYIPVFQAEQLSYSSGGKSLVNKVQQEVKIRRSVLQRKSK